MLLLLLLIVVVVVVAAIVNSDTAVDSAAAADADVYLLLLLLLLFVRLQLSRLKVTKQQQSIAYSRTLHQMLFQTLLRELFVPLSSC